jgi:hypothetical protein
MGFNWNDVVISVFAAYTAIYFMLLYLNIDVGYAIIIYVLGTILTLSLIKYITIRR